MKRNPYRAAFAAVTVTLLVACTQGETPKTEIAADPAVAAQVSLEAAMQADRDFAALAKAEGPKAAFLKYMHASDSQFLQPGAVVQGAEAIAAGFPEDPAAFSAEWAPDGGHGSASGDLAVTTGLYALSAGGQTVESGRYVTVWRRDADGELKAVMDMSVPEPQPASPS